MLTITENEPTSILKDFAAFIRYLKSHRVVLTKVNEFISGKDLFELNKQMTHPLPNTVIRTTNNTKLLSIIPFVLSSGSGWEIVPESSGKRQNGFETNRPSSII